MAVRILTTDMHTAGEPLRIVRRGAPEPEGRTVLERRRWLQENSDWARKVLMWEPRGHADMYGCYLVPPEREGSDFGAIFMHNQGYSTMCGHATLALARFAVDEGLAKDPQRVVIDVPAGQVIASAEYEDQRYVQSAFTNVQSFVWQQDQEINVSGLGSINYDIAFGGAFYALVEAAQLDLSLEASSVMDHIRVGRQIKEAVRSRGEPQHPEESDLSFLYGVIFTSPPHDRANHSRNVCVFADGEVDRSPTGSGVSARIAKHVLSGEVALGEEITIESLIGSTMTVKATEKTHFGCYESVAPRVTGCAYYTGSSEFVIEEDDPLGAGFLVR